MKLLLMPQKQISPSKASRAFWTLKRLLLGMGSLMALQMLKAGKRALAGATDVRSGFIGLWRREIGRTLGVHRNGRGFGLAGLVSQAAQHSNQELIVEGTQETRQCTMGKHTGFLADRRTARGGRGRSGRIRHGGDSLERIAGVTRHSHRP